MFDTNILYSAIVLKSIYLNEILENVVDNHVLILCSYVVDELYDVAARKHPGKENDLYEFMSEQSFELVNSLEFVEEKDMIFEIRDEDDYIILHTAIVEKIDVLITNDKDFFEVDIKCPHIITPKEFKDNYM